MEVDVVGLDVAMDDARVVRVIEPDEDIGDDAQRGKDADAALRSAEQVPERQTVELLHHEIGPRPGSPVRPPSRISTMFG